MNQGDRYLERVLNLIDTPAEETDAPDAVTLKEIKGDVQADDVHFSYDPEREIPHGCSFHAKPGQVIAVIGETGCGKTTLINLLMRFYDTDMKCTARSLRHEKSPQALIIINTCGLISRIVLHIVSRNDPVRTGDLYVPNVALYQLSHIPSVDILCTRFMV